MPSRTPPNNAGRSGGARGLTLIEICVVLALVGVLAALAWPSMKSQMQRARRLDATAALTRMQIAQEQHRARFGVYGADLAALAGAGSARSGEGHYELLLREASAERVTLAARARADGAQQSDRECPEITLQLIQGQAEQGPSSRCWNQ
jgi:type IV pilus assembly protein PilE